MQSKPQHPLIARFNQVVLATSVTTVPVAVVMSPTEADGAIVSSGLVNLDIPSTTNGLYLNVLNGALNSGGGGGVTVPGWDINPWSASGFGLFSPANPSGGAYVVTATNVAANVATGTSIGTANTYGSGNAANITQWNLNSSDNLIGFRFLNENTSQIHYGWARVQFGATISSPRSLVEYAFEDSPGQSILAGAGAAIPEPSSLALLALGATGLARRRRKLA